jgi:hypothetical protein
MNVIEAIRSPLEPLRYRPRFIKTDREKYVAVRQRYRHQHHGAVTETGSRFEVGCKSMKRGPWGACPFAGSGRSGLAVAARAHPEGHPIAAAS